MQNMRFCKESLANGDCFKTLVLIYTFKHTGSTSIIKATRYCYCVALLKVHRCTQEMWIAPCGSESCIIFSWLLRPACRSLIKVYLTVSCYSSLHYHNAQPNKKRDLTAPWSLLLSDVFLQWILSSQTQPSFSNQWASVKYDSHELGGYLRNVFCIAHRST